MSTAGRLFVGIDWGNAEHAVVVEDEAGEKLWRGSVKHSGTALREIVERLMKLAEGDMSRLRVGLERPEGAVVSTMLEWGIWIGSINPYQMSAFRTRYSPSGAKDDFRDAGLLSRLLRTDGECFRRLSAKPVEVVSAGGLSRMHEGMTGEVVALSNQVRAVLHEYYPQFLEAVRTLDRPWVFELFRKAKKPSDVKRLKKAWLEALLKRHRSKTSAAEVLEVLKQESLITLPGQVETAVMECGYLMDRLELVVTQLRSVDKLMEKSVERMVECGDGAGPKGVAEAPGAIVEGSEKGQGVCGERAVPSSAKILQSLPGAGVLTVSVLMSEAYWAIQGVSELALRALCGTAPVTVQSGKSLQVNMRKSCNARLRHVVHHWAKAAMIHDDTFRAVYARSKARGHRTGAALRRVGDKLIRVYMALLRKGELYSPGYREMVAIEGLTT